MRGTMQDFPLTIQMILRHGMRVYPNSEVITFEGETTRRSSFREVGERVEKLAAALKRLGIKEGDRVGTFAWNRQEHLEAYFAIPCMGAVLHTLNIRLFPDQLAYVINHAQDRMIIVDDSLVPLLARVKDQLKTVEQYIVIGSGDASALGEDVLRYDDLLAAERPGFAWPDVDERSAAAMCYTSGTTGDPKGVVYEHRSTVLHSMGANTAAGFGLRTDDTILAIVPMFHANCWGLPYAGWMAGSSFVFPTRFLQGEPLAKMIETFRPTVSGAVPTVLSDLLRHADEHKPDMSSLRLVLCGGSAVPRALMEGFERHGVKVLQGWGMTETSPLCAAALPPPGAQGDDEMNWRVKTGRIIFGVELRITDDAGNELPWDESAVGEIEVRGPWITRSYYLDPSPDKFDDGWLRTGDVANMNELGFIQITDRAKDVIKSGGEWISSVELENLLMGHPAVLEASVVGVPDERWDERPLACVVLKEGADAKPEELRQFLSDKVAKWWLPERWAFVSEIPKTSVGKFDKKVLRAKHTEGELEVREIAG